MDKPQGASVFQKWIAATFPEQGNGQLGKRRTGEFFQSESNVLQCLDICYLIERRSLQLLQESFDCIRVEPFGDGVQPVDSAHNRLQHPQNFLFGGRITDQFWLVDPPILTQYVSVETRADGFLQAQDALIEIVVLDSAARSASLFDLALPVTAVAICWTA